MGCAKHTCTYSSKECAMNRCVLRFDVCFGSRRVSWGAGVRRDNCYLFMCFVAVHRGTRLLKITVTVESASHY
jgi:hypothetical protein